MSMEYDEPLQTVVYRYSVIPLLNGMCEIEVPEGGVFLRVEHYKGDISLWYRTYRGCPMEKRRVYQAGTGIAIPKNVVESFNYLGTVITSVLGFDLVYHVYISG